MKTVDEFKAALEKLHVQSVLFAGIKATNKSAKLKVLTQVSKQLDAFRSCSEEKHGLFNDYLQKQHVIASWIGWYNKEVLALGQKEMSAFPRYKLIYTAIDKDDYEMLLEDVEAARSNAVVINANPLQFIYSAIPDKCQIVFTGDIIGADALLFKLGRKNGLFDKCIERVLDVAVKKLAPSASSSQPSVDDGKSSTQQSPLAYTPRFS